MTPPVPKSLRPRRLAVFRSHRKHFTRAAFAALVSALSLPLISPRAQAATYTWDPTGTNPTAPAGGTGTWDTTSAFWSNGTTDVAWPNTVTTLADFAGTAGTVTMGSALNAQGVQFDTGGYTLNTGTFTLTMGSTGVVTTNTTGTTTIAGTLAASAAETWSVAAGGTLQLNANFTSATATNVFQINSAGTTNITGTFNVAGKSTLSGGGTFNLSGTETFGSASGDYTGIANTTVNMTAGTAAFASPQAFFIGNGGNGTTSTLNVTGGTASLTAAVPLRIGNSYNGASGTNTGNGVLSVGGGAGTGTFTTGTTASTINLGFTGSTGTVNLLTNGVFATNRAFAAGATGNAVINFNGGTLQATGTALAIPATVTTNIADNGGTIDPNGFAVTIATNFTHGGTAATDGGLRIGASTTGTGNVTLSGILSQTGGLTFNVGGSLAGNNTYTGATAINAFVDARTSGNVFGATGTGNGTTINTGGTVRFRDTSNATIPEAFTFAGGTFLAYNDPGTTTLSGQITLNAANTTISVSPQGQNSTTLALTGGIVEGGTASNLTLSRSGAATSAASNDVISITGASTYGGTTTITDANTSSNTGVFSVQLSGGDNRLPVTTAVTLNSARLTLGNATGASNQTLTGLTTGNTNAANAVVGGSTAISTLTLNIATAGTNTYGGLLGGTAANANNLALTKAGAGLLTLTAANTYTGNTTVTGGTLAVSGSINGSPLVSVGTTGTLTLSNTAAAVIGDNAMLSLVTGATLNLNAAGGTSETVDMLVLNGVTQAAGTYTAAQLTALAPTIIFTSGSGETLTVTSVPEPSTYACVFVALFGLGVYARSRRARREA